MDTERVPGLTLPFLGILNLPMNGVRTSSSAASPERSHKSHKFKRASDGARCCGRGRPHSVQLAHAALSRDLSLLKSSPETDEMRNVFCLDRDHFGDEGVVAM